jgi:hypothetical protein
MRSGIHGACHRARIRLTLENAPAPYVSRFRESCRQPRGGRRRDFPERFCYENFDAFDTAYHAVNLGGHRQTNRAASRLRHVAIAMNTSGTDSARGFMNRVQQYMVDVPHRLPMVSDLGGVRAGGADGYSVFRANGSRKCAPDDRHPWMPVRTAIKFAQIA